jgi:uncharacterized RmlC-like cupin family protein
MTRTGAHQSRGLRRHVGHQLLTSTGCAIAEECAVVQKNAKIVKAFTREGYETELYKTLAWQQFAITRKRVRANSAIGAFITFRFRHPPGIPAQPKNRSRKMCSICASSLAKPAEK